MKPRMGPNGHSRVKEKLIITQDKERFQAFRGLLTVTLHRYLRPKKHFRISVIGDDDSMLELEGSLDACLELYDAIVDGATWDGLMSRGMVQG